MKLPLATPGLEIPVGVSLTHDKGYPIIFAYVGGSRGRLGMRAKRFNPRVIGSVEKALKQAVRWRKQALREHEAAVAALPALPPRTQRKAVKTTASAVASRHRGKAPLTRERNPAKTPARNSAPATAPQPGVKAKASARSTRPAATPKPATTANKETAGRAKASSPGKTVGKAHPSTPTKRPAAPRTAPKAKISGSKATSRRGAK